jgi:hypothetical protein
MDDWEIFLMEEGWLKEPDGQFKHVITNQIMTRVMALHYSKTQLEQGQANMGNSLQNAHTKAQEGRQERIARKPTLEELDRQ